MKYAKKILSKFSSGFIVFVKVLTITTKNGIDIKNNEKVDGKKSSKEGLTELAQGSFGFDYVCNVGDWGCKWASSSIDHCRKYFGDHTSASAV